MNEGEDVEGPVRSTASDKAAPVNAVVILIPCVLIPFPFPFDLHRLLRTT